MQKAASGVYQAAQIHESLKDSGMGRREFIKWMAWAGTGQAFPIWGGIARSDSVISASGLSKRCSVGVDER